MYNIIDKRDEFDFGQGEINSYSDFIITSSHKDIQKHYDVLIFTDSKGSVANFVSHSTVHDTKLKYDGLWTERLVVELEERKLSFLLICRPRILTIFFTLINFLKRNDISYKYLVTNVGFVDFTPKKLENMMDIELQIPSEEYHLKSSSYQKLSPYKLSSGEIQDLYTFNYGDIQKEIAKELDLRFKYALLLGCLEFSPSIDIPRKRPVEFFTQLNQTNKFLFDIANLSNKIHYLQPFKYPYGELAELSLDAVHYSDIGHEIFYKLMKPFIDIYLV